MFPSLNRSVGKAQFCKQNQADLLLPPPLEQIGMDKVPNHISFVLDGNRRWAKASGLPAWQGHIHALESVESLVRWCFDAEVKYLTLYLFSTENWNRAEEELAKLLGPVAQAAIEKKFPILMELGAKVNIFGSTDRFAKPIGEALRKLEQDSAANNNIVVNFCVDYGGRTELVNAVREIVKENPAQVDEATIEKHLYSAGIPDPDLMIRTGGAHRVSNFLLWQQAYTEFYFVDKYLPDFTQEDFKEALRWYAEEERRFGK